MSKNKRNSFTKRWSNLTQIGRPFGLSGVAVGKILKEAGWREADGSPSEHALKNDLCVSTPLSDGRPHFMWNRKACNKLLTKLGHCADHRMAEFRETAAGLMSLFREAQNRMDQDADKEALIIYDGLSMDFELAVHDRGDKHAQTRAILLCRALVEKKMPRRDIEALLRQAGYPMLVSKL